MSDLSMKRKKTTIAICAAIGGIGFVSATPTSNLDFAKQVFMATATVAMYVVIWDIYFDEDLSQKTITAIVADLSLITLMSAGTAWIVAIAIAMLLRNIPDGFGLFTWVVAGIVTGMAAGLLGLAWACYCDDLYRNPK